MMKLQFNFSNRALYTIIALLVIIGGLIIVYAVIPNPGHSISQIDIPTTGCTVNQVLQWSGTAWQCAYMSGTSSFRGVLVRRSNMFSVPGVSIPITWNIEDYDTDNFHDNSVNPERLTVPAGVTKVRLSASIYWNSGVGTLKWVRLYENTWEYRYLELMEQTSNDQLIHSGVSPVLNVNPGDYFYLKAGHNLIGQEYNIVGGTTNLQTWFAMEIIE